MFAKEVSEVVGNSILCAAFIAYGGYYEMKVRETLMVMWEGPYSSFHVL